MQPHDFWQELHAPDTFDPMEERADFHVAELPDGRQLRLPIRVLSDGEHALASLIVNQASFTVLEALAEALAERIAAYDIDVIAGLPTLGLTLAAATARARGHARYVPLGTSRKFWYRDELSVALSSITTPNQEKRLYIDPRMLPLLQGKRVALIDDVISSGASIVSGLALLASCDIEPAVIGAAMLQSDRWRDRVDLSGKRWSERIVGVFSTPILEQGENGCWRRPG
jgi:adenine/guanine phosphoribosyltransferase-like PRPP-binding protein